VHAPGRLRTEIRTGATTGTVVADLVFVKPIAFLLPLIERALG
jgi:hypothetical protein